MEKVMKFSVILGAVDKMSKVMQAAGDGAIKTLRRVKKEADDIAKSAFSFGRNAMAVGAAAGAMLAGPTVMAANFQKEMGNVATLIDTTSESMQKMGADVIGVSKRVPVALSDLTSSLYDVRSAGIAADQAINVLETSAQLSVAGLASTSEATNIMTSALNAFKGEGLTAAQTADILFKTVKAGKTTVSQLSQAFGATAPIVQDAGVKLADFQAATAALTTVGIPASQAQQQLRQAIVSIIKPTADMQALFQQIGVKDGRQLIATSENMGEVFAKVRKASEASGVSLEKAAGSVEALNAMLSVTGATNAVYTSTLADMTSGANQLDEAFQKQLGNAHQQFELLKNQGQALGITIGDVLLPRLMEIGEKITPIIQNVADWIERNPKLTEGIVMATAGIAAFSLAIGAGALVVGGIAKAVSFFTTVMTLLSNAGKIMTAVQWAWNAAMTANPIGLVIVGVAALVAVIALAWNKSKKFRGTIKGMWAAMKQFGNIMKQYVIDRIKGLLSGISGVGRAMSLLFSGDFDGAWSAAKQSFKDMSGIQATQNAMNSMGSVKTAYKDAYLGETRPGLMALGSGVMAPAPKPNPVGGGSTSVQYAPTITLQGSYTPQQREEFVTLLNRHKDEVARAVNDANTRNARTAF